MYTLKRLKDQENLERNMYGLINIKYLTERGRCISDVRFQFSDLGNFRCHQKQEFFCRNSILISTIDD